MKRALLVAALVAFMAFMVITATPEKTHAESGCGDADRLITAGSYFRLGWQCNVSGDVAMRNSSEGAYQRLYDDDDASTGNIIRCTDINGCDVFANWGGYVSARDATTMAVDTFKYVATLRYIDTKCFPANCGATRYFPSLTPPYYTTSVSMPAVPPVYAPPSIQSGITPGISKVYARTSVLAGLDATITIKGVIYRLCWFSYVPEDGDGFNVTHDPVWPQQQGYPRCGAEGTVSGPQVSPSTGTVNGRVERNCTQPACRFNPNEAAIGDQIYQDDGRSCSVGNTTRPCYTANATSAGWVVKGWVNPQSWRVPSPTLTITEW